MLSHIRQRLERLASSEVNPRRTAAAIALGVFLSFSPLLGLQIVLGLAAASVFRLSRVAVLVGLCANLPWIMVPWYMLTTAAAASVVGHSRPIDAHINAGLFEVPVFSLAFVARTNAIAAELFWPFLLGPTTGALVLAVAAYVVCVRMLSRRNIRLSRASPETTPSPGLARDAE